VADDVAITIPAELDEALRALATAQGKSKTALVRDALAEFVLNEQAFVAAVEEGRAEARAGNLIDHEDVMREIDALLAKDQ
jgi:predicted transcriptional regulator